MIRIYLSRLLGDRRMKQKELADLTGIRPSTISDLYNEMCDRVNLDHLDRICEALDCTLTDLIDYVPNTIRRTGADLIVEPQKFP
ncbi:MAG TPA: helix-turn-helix transcriptional regulator [Clostridia bacterium]|nr:helix-turn-helix transcriptional regulator [Clostridia bacterium]